MDPFIFCLVLAWMLQRGAVDVMATARGKTSPRLQMKLARARAGNTQYGLGDYMRDLWSDGLQHHTARRRAKADRGGAVVESKPAAELEPTSEPEPELWHAPVVGWMGQASDAGRHLIAHNKCAWGDSGGFCKLPREADSPFCPVHTGDYATEFGHRPDPPEKAEQSKVKKFARACADEFNAQADATERDSNRWEGDTAGEVLRSAARNVKERMNGADESAEVEPERDWRAPPVAAVPDLDEPGLNDPPTAGVPTPLASVVPIDTKKGNDDMSTTTDQALTGEIVSLPTALNYTRGYAEKTGAAHAWVEQAIAKLQGGEVSGDVLMHLTTAGESLNTAKAAFEAAEAELERQLSVRDAYEATPGAGNKQFVTGE